MTGFGVIGLGEAGRLYAAGLRELGQQVIGYDPFVDARDSVTELVETLDELAARSDVLISLVGASAAPKVAAQVAPFLHTGAIFADLNTASPATKREIAQAVERDGVLFTDVAVLAPVPRAGARTPLMASGTGSAELERILAPLGVPIEAIGGAPGDAAGRKLLRSVFMKGLAALVIESLGAAHAAGQREWMHGQIVAELGPGADALVDRLVDGSRQHAERRMHEVADSAAFVEALGEPSWMTRSAQRWLSRLNDENRVAVPAAEARP